MHLDATRQMVHIFDISRSRYPWVYQRGRSRSQVADFCSKGGRFGSHETQNTFDPIYYKRVLFVTLLQRRPARCRYSRSISPQGDRVLHSAPQQI